MNFGAKCDDTTDDTTALNNAIAAAQAYGSGTVLVSKTCRINGVISPPYTGTTSAVMVAPVHIQGASWTESGSFGTNPPNGAMLDLRFNGDGGTHVAKIDTRGLGVLEIDHIILSSPADSFPMLQTTNTTLLLHDMKMIGNASAGSAAETMIVLGAQNTDSNPGTNGIGGNRSDAPFNGFGTHIQNVYFDQCKHAIEFNSDANGVFVLNPTVSNTCGSATANDGPFQFWASGYGTNGNVIIGGICELTNYPVCFAFVDGSTPLLSAGNTILGIGLYDPGGGVTTGAAYLTSASYDVQNTFLLSWVPYAMTTAGLLQGAGAAKNILINAMGTGAGKANNVGATCNAGLSGTSRVVNGIVTVC
jgi:hypothetical protein